MQGRNRLPDKDLISNLDHQLSVRPLADEHALDGYTTA